MIIVSPKKINFAADRETLLANYRRVRRASIAMCEPLTPEMFRVQPMDDVSPPWWNLGHTTWFFARNVLEPFGGQSAPEDADFDYVLNSYYAALGPRIERDRRGSSTFPTTDDVYRYRASVDGRIERLISTIDADRWDQLASTVIIGLNHEQQHQELFYTEIKYILWQNPPRLRRPYRDDCNRNGSAADPSGSTPIASSPTSWKYSGFEGGLFDFGHREPGFCWDNELPVHPYYLQPFEIADRLVTNGEYLEFVRDGGYQRQLLWLDNGWSHVQRLNWQAPLYWERIDADVHEWTLDGLLRLDPSRPVSHVSFYEADAFVRWRAETYLSDRDAVLPEERQWEHAARAAEDPSDDAFLDSGLLHPSRPYDHRALSQMFGVVWQWTSSYYEPYPGYRPFAGALGEYNSKFMDNQRVLRGGSCVTPRDHFHLSYRNFWPAPTRFQFTGLRLARHLEG